MVESHKMGDSDRKEDEGSLWEMSGAVLHVQAAAASEMEVVSKDDDRKDANFKELKEVRTAMAQARLAELEERLNRLQLKTSLLKTKPDEPIGIMPDNWALPGTVDERHSNIMQTTADNTATVRPQKSSPKGDLEDLNMSINLGVEISAQRNPAINSGGKGVKEKLMYTRPISPSTVRHIIREELALVAKESIHRSSTKSQTNRAYPVNFLTSVGLQRDKASLRIQVWDSDTLNNDLLGEHDVNIDLENVPQNAESKTVSFEMILKGEPAGKVVLSFLRDPESESALAGLLYVTVHSIHGFISSSGWMDRTDPYVSLEFGKEKLKTTCKENAGGENVLFMETLEFHIEQLEQEENNLQGAESKRDFLHFMDDYLENEPMSLKDCVRLSCPVFFGGFTRRSLTRQICFAIRRSLFCQAFFMVAILANCLYILLSPEFLPRTTEDGVERQESLAEYALGITVTALLGLEMLFGVIAFGFCISKTSYLQNSMFNRLDFICLVVIVLEYAGRHFNFPKMTVRPFFMLRLFKPLAAIKSFNGVKSIILTLMQCGTNLMLIFGMLLTTMAVWTVLALLLYGGSFRRRCVTIQDGVTSIAPGYPFEQWCKVVAFEAHYNYDTEEWIPPDPSDIKRTELFNRYNKQGLLRTTGYYDKQGWSNIFVYPKDPYGRWHTCQREVFLAVNATVTSMCEDVGNPAGGFSHFDNVWGAMASLSHCIAPDSYYDILLRAIQSEPYIASGTVAFFVFINAVDTFLLLSLFVSLVTGTFKRVREKYSVSGMLTLDQHKKLSVAHTECEPRLTQPNDQSAEVSIQRTSSSGVTSIELEKLIWQGAVSLSQSTIYQTMITLTIILQICWMVLDVEVESPVANDFVYLSNIICTSIFVFDVILNCVAAGSLTKYWDSLLNKCESILVISGIIGGATGYKLLIMIPALRGYRLIAYIPTLRHMLDSAGASAQVLFNVVVFFISMMIVFTVAARYMFDARIGKISRTNFDNLAQSSLTMLQLLTGDSWSGVLYSAMQAFPQDYGTQFFGAALVIIWFVFSNLIAKNVFIAAIIENFSIKDTLEAMQAPGMVSIIRQSVRGTIKTALNRRNAIIQGRLHLDTNTGLVHPKQAARQHLLKMRALLNKTDKVQSPPGTGVRRLNVYQSSIMQVSSTFMAQKPIALQEPEERVLFVLELSNPIRQAFLWIAKHSAFDSLVFLAILTTCFFLIIERPYKDMVLYPGTPDGVYQGALVPVNHDTIAFVERISTYVFTVEFICRVMAHGLILTKNAYLKSGWNIMDTVVLVVAWLQEITGESNNVKVLRVAQSLKPLRLIKRNPSMRAIVDGLISTLPPLFYVAVFLFFTMFFFALIGMSLFQRKLHSCNNPGVAFPMGKAECSNYWIRGTDPDTFVAFPSSWALPYHFSFETFTESLLSLAFVSSFKYVGILYACMDVTGEDLQPLANYNIGYGLFFVVYIAVGGLFVMNLFVAYIIDGFSNFSRESAAEKIYASFQRHIINCTPQYAVYAPPTNKLSATLRRLMESSAFRSFSSVCVMINFLFMLAASEDTEAGTVYSDVIEMQSFVFLIELAVEVGLHLVACGVGGLYNDISRLAEVVSLLWQSVGYWLPNSIVYRVGKIFRIIRLIVVFKRHFKPARDIIDTFVLTIPYVANVMLLLVIFYSIFAIGGVSLFATTKFGWRYGHTASFQEFGPALLTIFQIITGDEWMILLVDLSVEPPFCERTFTMRKNRGYKGPDRSWGDCGQGKTISSLYFLAVKLVCEYCLLNLFIGIIIENFGFITEEAGLEDDAEWNHGPSMDQIQQYAYIFQKFDRGSGCVAISSLHALLCIMPVPLGYRMPDGTLRIDSNDLVLEYLMRAEFNLVLIRERAAALRFKGLQKPGTKPVFINKVSFGTLMFTLLHWRIPRHVPDSVKWERTACVEECALVAQALKCIEFFRALVARRKRERIQAFLAKRIRMLNWPDPHRKRRNRHVQAVLDEQNAVATLPALPERLAPMEFRQKQPLLNFFNIPTDDMHCIVLEWIHIEDMPKSFVDHGKAVRKHSMMHVPTPSTGIEVLQNKAQTHSVVMRLVDPNNVDSTGRMLLADFSKVKWREWQLVNSKLETYFEPNTWAGVDVNGRIKPKVAWDRIDLYVKGKSSTSKSTSNSDSHRRLGSIQEFQSYVTNDQHSTAKRSADRVMSHIRVNLGDHRYTSKKLQLRKRKYDEVHDTSQMKKWSSHMKRSVGSALSKTGSAMPQSRSRMSQSRVSSSALSAEGNDSATFNCDAVLEVLGYIPLWGNGETESKLKASFGKKEDLRNPSEEDKEDRLAKSRRGTPSIVDALTAGLGAATAAATAAAQKTQQVGISVGKKVLNKIEDMTGVDIDGDGTIAGELDLELRNINAGKVQLQVKVYRISDFPEYTGFMDKTDPYVQLTLGDNQPAKTSTKTNAGGSVDFDEILTLFCSEAEAGGGWPTLQVEVLDSGLVTDQQLGCVTIDLGTQQFLSLQELAVARQRDCCVFKTQQLRQKTGQEHKGTVMLAFSSETIHISKRQSPGWKESLDIAKEKKYVSDKWDVPVRGAKREEMEEREERVRG